MYTADYKFGIESEDSCLPRLSKFLNTNLTKLGSRSPIDFESDTHLVELKTRRNTKDKYPTTMIGKNKIDKLLESDKIGYIAFNFLNGLYGVKVTPELIKKCCIGSGGRRDRGRVERSVYCYVPVDQLEKIN